MRFGISGFLAPHATLLVLIREREPARPQPQLLGIVGRLQVLGDDPSFLRGTRCALYLILKPGCCLSTSGTYERQVEIDGTKFSHLTGPRIKKTLGWLRVFLATWLHFDDKDMVP
jgi:hypothetical protein